MAFKRILCAVDFSHDSIEAFHAAVEMTRLYGGSLHLFHVMEAQPSLPGEVAIEILQKANAAIEGLLASEQSSLRGLAFTTEVTSGRAFDEIVNRARQWKANLIVLGSKGTTLLGGTAEAVTREAPCSVLVVRPDHKH